MSIGLDAGGTHTDVVLLADEGLVNQIKVPTDPSELYHSVLTGLDRITAGTDYAAIQRIVLSTTLTTNAVVQDKFPPVAMIVSAGPGIDPQHYRIGIRVCTDCGGAWRIDSSSDRGSHILAVHIPNQACGACRNQGYQ
jgi:hypothetical protein